MLNVAETDVALVVTFEKLNPEPLIVDNAAPERLLPVIVTTTLVPLAPLLGLTPGACGFAEPDTLMMKLKFAVPPLAVNVTEASPGLAVFATENVAVAVVPSP